MSLVIGEPDDCIHMMHCMHIHSTQEPSLGKIYIIVIFVILVGENLKKSTAPSIYIWHHVFFILSIFDHPTLISISRIANCFGIVEVDERKQIDGTPKGLS